jgi:DNA repair protein RadC
MTAEGRPSNNQEDSKHYLGHRKRLKSKFLKDCSNFADYEILELLLFSSHPRKDVKILAKKLLAEFGSIKAVLHADEILLRNLQDVNEGVLVSFKLAREILVRSSKNTILHKPILSGWQQLCDYCRLTMANLKEEQFRVLFLDKNHHLIADDLLANGDENEVEINIKKIIKKSLNYFASSIILMHNHPNGNCNPSKSDIISTKKIIEAMKVVNIKIYDHLIIDKDGNFFSFKSEGFL